MAFVSLAEADLALPARFTLGQVTVKARSAIFHDRGDIDLFFLHVYGLPDHRNIVRVTIMEIGELQKISKRK
jgi:hypothetical protein